MLSPRVLSRLSQVPALSLVLLGGNVLLNVVASVGFKMSAASSSWRGFLFWQVVGNLSGFLAVLTFTALLRFLPLHVVHPLSVGLTIIAVQVVASRLIFGEVITASQWVGVALLLGGIFLIVRR